MARFKPKKSKTVSTATSRGAIPCLVIIVLGMVFMSLLFYFFMKSGAQ